MDKLRAVIQQWMVPMSGLHILKTIMHKRIGPVLTVKLDLRAGFWVSPGLLSHE